MFCFLALDFNLPKIRASDGLPVHKVNTGEDYSTIQEAINVAETLDGHTIAVDSGTYYGQVTINKSISLIAQSGDMLTIDGGGTETVIEVNADNVTINGFNIRNNQAGTAILLDNSLNCSLYNTI